MDTTNWRLFWLDITILQSTLNAYNNMKSLEIKKESDQVLHMNSLTINVVPQTMDTISIKKNIQLMVRNIVSFLYSVYLLLFTFLLIFELESFSFYITLDTISLSLTVWDFLTDIMSSPCGCHHCLDICQTELYNRLQQTIIYTKLWHFSISLASCVLKDSPPNRNSFTISKPSKSIRM